MHSQLPKLVVQCCPNSTRILKVRHVTFPRTFSVNSNSETLEITWLNYWVDHCERDRGQTKTKCACLRTNVCYKYTAPWRVKAEKFSGIQSTICNVIRRRLCLRYIHKDRVHSLLPRHIAEHKTNCFKLYERHLAG